MCGRYMMTSPIEAMRRAFGVIAHAGIPQRYNIAPRQPVLIVRNGEKGERELAAVEWGLIPEWKKEIGDKPLINARIETISEKPSFRSSIKRKRCLVPFDGWYEWKTVDGRKQPYLVKPTDGKLAAFAGIWSTWHGPAGEHWLETMAIVTAPAESSLKSLHHRIPLVVKPQDYGNWLALHDPLPRGFLQNFDFAPERAFEWSPVDTKVNSVRMEGPDCIAPPPGERQHSLF
jgi:putative SOS response-associated peptidase YedK